METFKTVKVFKNNYRKKTINKGLTETEAQAEVKKDIEINPNSEKYMLIYTKEA